MELELEFRSPGKAIGPGNVVDMNIEGGGRLYFYIQNRTEEGTFEAYPLSPKGDDFELSTPYPVGLRLKVDENEDGDEDCKAVVEDTIDTYGNNAFITLKTQLAERTKAIARDRERIMNQWTSSVVAREQIPEMPSESALQEVARESRSGEEVTDEREALSQTFNCARIIDVNLETLVQFELMDPDIVKILRGGAEIGEETKPIKYKDGVDDPNAGDLEDTYYYTLKDVLRSFGDWTPSGSYTPKKQKTEVLEHLTDIEGVGEEKALEIFKTLENTGKAFSNVEGKIVEEVHGCAKFYEAAKAGELITQEPEP